MAPYRTRLAEGEWRVSLLVSRAAQSARGCAFPSCTSISQTAPESVSVSYSRQAERTASGQAPLSAIRIVAKRPAAGPLLQTW